MQAVVSKHREGFGKIELVSRQIAKGVLQAKQTEETIFSRAGGNRTHKVLLPADFKSAASAMLLTKKQEARLVGPPALVGARGFEPPTSPTRTVRASRAAPRPEKLH